MWQKAEKKKLSLTLWLKFACDTDPRAEKLVAWSINDNLCCKTSQKFKWCKWCYILRKHFNILHSSNRCKDVFRIKLCLLLWLHFSFFALLFLIFLCVFRYSVRPSFGHDRQIVVDNILILSRGKRRNYMWNTNDSHEDWGSDTQWSAVRCKWKAILVERLKPGPYTNYSFTTKTALVNSRWAGLFIQNIPRWTASVW